MSKFRLSIGLYGFLLIILLFSVLKFNPIEDRKVIRLFTMYDKNQPMVLSQFLIDFKKDIEKTTNLDLEIVSIVDSLNITKNPAIALKYLNNGDFQLVHGVGYYWKKEIPEIIFFSSVPFGMYHELFQDWIQKGGGDTLWKKSYAVHNLNKIIPFMCGNTGPQWGGVSSREIISPNSFKNLDFRLPGIGGDILTAFGGINNEVFPIQIPEFARMPKNKFIDWVGPEGDIELIIKNWHFPYNMPNKLYYYSNGWFEPSTQYEMLINADFLKSLNPDVSDKLEIIVAKYDAIILSKFLEKNDLAYEQLKRKPIVNNINIEITSFNKGFIEAAKLELDTLIMPYKNNTKSNCIICDQVQASYYKYKKLNDTRNIDVIRNDN